MAHSSCCPHGLDGLHDRTFAHTYPHCQTENNAYGDTKASASHTHTDSRRLSYPFVNANDYSLPRSDSYSYYLYSCPCPCYE